MLNEAFVSNQAKSKYRINWSSSNIYIPITMHCLQFYHQITPNALG